MNKSPLVCVDAGHGGSDPGAVAGGHREADIALAHAIAVGRALNRVGARTVFTRIDDRTLSLEQRSNKANDVGADIFVSMHCNASLNTKAFGAWILYRKQSMASKLLAGSIARFLDAVIEPHVTGDAVEHSDQSPYVGYTRLAQEVIAAKRPGQSDADALRAAGVVSPYRSIAVLRDTKMPAIMVEAGFITNADDRARMLDNNHIELMAAAVAAEIAKFIVTRKS